MPCHNEADNAGRYPSELFPALDALGVSWELVLVDDGSTDATAAALSALAAARPADVRTVSLSPNRGLGGALRAGFAESRGEWIATLDADLTFPPPALKAMLEAARGGADLVAGTPYQRAADMAEVPWARKLPSFLLNALYRGLFGMSLSAYTPMMRVYKASRLRALPLEAEGFEISAEIAARAMLEGWKVAELPVPLLTRTSGVSKLRRWRELKRHAALIWRLLAGR